MMAVTRSTSPALSRRRSGVRRGFTLIEVLTAIMVLAITVPSLMQAYITAGNLADYSRQRVEALSVGQSEIEQLVAKAAGGMGTGGWQSDPLNGSVDSGAGVYNWVATLSSWGDASTENQTMQQLTMTVTWVHAHREYEVNLATLVYTPLDSSTTGGLGSGGLSGGLMQ